MGYCSDGWWLNQQFCCWEIDNNEGGRCRAWHVWTHSSALSWLIYVVVAVSAARARLRVLGAETDGN
jgi:chloride channel 3/4/5